MPKPTNTSNGALQSVEHPDLGRNAHERARLKAEIEVKAEKALYTAELKQSVRESLADAIFPVVAYVVFAILAIHDAKTHAGTLRADNDWGWLICISAGLFAFFMVRKVYKWEGRIEP